MDENTNSSEHIDNIIENTHGDKKRENPMQGRKAVDNKKIYPLNSNAMSILLVYNRLL